MTLQEYIAQHGDDTRLDGLTFVVPQRYVGKWGVPQQEMRLRSAWSMGDGRVGLWFQLPRSYPNGQTWPLTRVRYEEELLNWQVRVPVAA